jgi:capsular polysaccharide biosynthesis protein
MELKTLLSQFRVNIIPITVFAILLAVVAGVLAQTYTHQYTASLSFYVYKPHEVAPSGEYSYDGYYAQQIAESYTDTLVGLLENPDVLSQSLIALGINPALDLSNYKNSLDVEKVAPQLVTLKVSLNDRDQSSRLVTAISNNVRNQVSKFNNQRGEGVEVGLVEENPLLGENQVSPSIAGLAGFLLGLILGIGTVFFRTYLKG